MVRDVDTLVNSANAQNAMVVKNLAKTIKGTALFR